MNQTRRGTVTYSYQLMCMQKKILSRRTNDLITQVQTSKRKYKIRVFLLVVPLVFTLHKGLFRIIFLHLHAQKTLRIR
jgi:hypothetical protein